jgi:glyoxylase-like metal-dependent hydrolase (beta-lactamase superfamily II)
MIQTGWVAVKSEHRAFSGPAALRLPAIMASQSWTEWMPVTAFVIEHPEGPIAVDTGETAKIADPDYTACDGVTGMFYGRNLQFNVPEDEEIGAQLSNFGLPPERVGKVVMTHLHSDHMGGMSAFPRAQFLVSDAARNGHAGALMCRLPSDIDFARVTYGETAMGVFTNTMPITEDGSISIVPTPGHAHGHQSVLIQDEGKSVCLVGDAAFSLDQIRNGEIGGIVENHSDAVKSAGMLKEQIKAFGTIMLPTHDPDNALRLSQL